MYIVYLNIKHLSTITVSDTDSITLCHCILIIISVGCCVGNCHSLSNNRIIFIGHADCNIGAG